MKRRIDLLTAIVLITPLAILLLFGLPVGIGIASDQAKPVVKHSLTTVASATPVYPNGNDDTAALQAAYNACCDGDILTLRASPTCGKRFKIYGALNWTGTNNVNVDATGTELYASMGLSGTQAMITWGAPLGQRMGGLRWTGGNIIGSLTLQNVSNSFVEPVGCCTLIFQGDTFCSYNRICIPGGINGGAGNNYAIIFNQLNNAAWMNCNSFYDTPMHGATAGGKPFATIWQVNPNATYAPGITMFYHCMFEASPTVMFNVPGNMSATFSDCYHEGQQQLGVLGSGASITVRDPCGFPGTDSRLWIEGLRQR